MCPIWCAILCYFASLTLRVLFFSFTNTADSIRHYATSTRRVEGKRVGSWSKDIWCKAESVCLSVFFHVVPSCNLLLVLPLVSQSYSRKGKIKGWISEAVAIPTVLADCLLFGLLWRRFGMTSGLISRSALVRRVGTRCSSLIWWFAGIPLAISIIAMRMESQQATLDMDEVHAPSFSGSTSKRFCRGLLQHHLFCFQCLFHFEMNTKMRKCAPSYFWLSWRRSGSSKQLPMLENNSW